MRQKLIYFGFLIILFCMCSPVMAQTVEVASLSSFSTENPPDEISVRLLTPLELTDSLTLNPGIILQGNLIDVVSPKRLKRDAGFSFKPEIYTDENGISKKIDLNIISSYIVPVNKAGLAKNAVLGVGNYFIKGLSMGVSAVTGAVKNEEGNRLKSSAVSVYESSPLSLAEKGQDLYIEPEQRFYLKFPKPQKVSQNSDKSDEVKGQNYSYTIEKKE